MLNYIQNKFLIFFIAALFFIGLGYISILPVFEGFDETAHFSRVLENLSSPASIFNKNAYIDQDVADYSGPSPYSSGNPPFNLLNTYGKFFSDKSSVALYESKYRNVEFKNYFIPSNQFNWQIQHPPLYYILLSTVASQVKGMSIVQQFFALRLISYILALLGVIFAYGAVVKLSESFVDSISSQEYKVGFLIYPIIFPMFFLEFTRIGNDSLCIFLAGLLSYFLVLWFRCNYCIKYSFAIGVTLGFGLLTKAFFLPISVALGCFFAFKFFYKSARPDILKHFLSLFCMFIPVLIMGGSWYLYKFFLHHDSGLGFEAMQLAEQGGMVHGLRQNFSPLVFLRGLVVPFVSYFWAGSWSLVRLPIALYIPLFLLSLWTVKNYFTGMRNRGFFDILWLPVWLIVFIYLGLAWHVLVTMALNGIATSPGWYLHILMPWIAPAIGLGVVGILTHRIKKFAFFSLIFTALIFHIYAIWSYMTLFAGCSTKGDDKYFVFSSNFMCFNAIPQIIDRLNVLAYPYLGMISFIVGFTILIYLFVRITDTNRINDFV